MSEFERFENALVSWFAANHAKETPFKILVGTLFHKVTKNNFYRDIDFAKLYLDTTGRRPSSQPSNMLKNFKKETGEGSLSNAIGLFYIAKVHPGFDSFCSDIERELFGDNSSFENIFGWRPKKLPSAEEIESVEKGLSSAGFRPTLSPPRLAIEPTHYSRHLISTLGRGKEKATLRRFVSPKPGFRWLQLAGVAGQGKSRLADDLVQKIGEGWAAGILLSETLKAFQDQWKQWVPDRPHLMVIDYVIGSEDEIQKVFRGLAGRSFQHPVCLLILERQRWDRGGATVAEIGSEGRAAWFSRINDTNDGDDLAHAKFRFESGVLELQNLRPKYLASIVKQIARREGKVLTESSEFIQESLAKIDRQGRPLYAYFLARALMDGAFKAGWGSTELLHFALNRDHEKRWSQYFEGPAPNLTDDRPALRLALLATMIRSVDSAKLGEEFVRSSCKEFDLHQALVMVDGPMGTGLDAVGTTVPGLQPDLLGEWFVLHALERSKLAVPLARAAWKTAPNEMMAFLVRLTSDFPKHRSTKALLEFEPKGVAAKRYNAIGASAAAGQLFQIDEPIPPQMVRALRRAVRGGIPLAAFFLGVRRYAGIGTKRSKLRAIRWFLSGALAGQALCMAGLAKCLMDWFLIPGSLRLAAYLLRKSADQGNTTAMKNLAVLYLRGAGVRKNVEACVALLEKSASLGYGLAMKDLGELYYDGDGVAQDYAKAFIWLERGSLVGNGAAMNRLALCFARGHGVAPDMRKAIDWWRKGAAEGNGDAMVRLGRLHLDGVVVDGALVLQEDTEEAKNWFAKGTAAGADWDADELASLRALGIIPLPEDEIEALRQLTYEPLANDRTINEFLRHLSWRSLDVDEARPYLAKIAQAAVAMKRRFLATKTVIRDIRVAPLDFYQGYELVHLSLTDTYNKRWWSCSVAVGPDGAIILDGKAQRIRTLNSLGLHLNSIEEHEAYLRFFSEFFWGKNGAYHIVDDLKQLEFYSWVSAQRRGEIGATIQRLTRLQNRREGRVGLMFAATVLHGTDLSQCTFEVFQSGDVEMLQLNSRSEAMVVKGDQMAGPLRSTFRV
jgi:TPR repeat protein